jgi:hypothetical protein
VRRDPTRWANRVTTFLNRQGIPVPTPGLVTLMTVRYRAPESPGFTVTARMLSWRGRFEVEVADPRIDRRLVLACLTALTALVLWTPLGEGIASISPFHR